MSLSPARDLLNKIRTTGHQRADCALHLADTYDREARAYVTQADRIESRAKRASDLILKRAAEDAQAILAQSQDEAQLLREKAECLFARASATRAEGTLRKQEADLGMVQQSSNILFQFRPDKKAKDAEPDPHFQPLPRQVGQLPGHLPALDASLEKPSFKGGSSSPSPGVETFLRKLRPLVRQIFSILRENGGPMSVVDIRNALQSRYPREYLPEDADQLYKRVGMTLGRYKQGPKSKGTANSKRTGLFESTTYGSYQILPRLEAIAAGSTLKPRRKNTPIGIARR